MSKLTVIACAAALAFMPSVAAAGTSAVDGERRTTIDLSSHGLDDSAGAERAHRVIDRAVRVHCYTPGARSVQDMVAEARCRSDAMAEIARQVRAPALLALIEGGRSRRAGLNRRADLGIRSF